MAFRVQTEMVIDWTDGAKIRLKRLSREQVEEISKHCREKCITNAAEISSICLEQSIVGWEEIIEEGTDKPLEFNPYNRTQIWSFMQQDEVVLKKFISFFRGPLGNLKTGLTASLNTDGQSAPADNASQTENTPANKDAAAN